MTGSAIYFLLSAEPDVTEIVGDRIYPDTAAQAATGDFVVFQKIDGNPSDQKQGVSQLDNERWQVDGYCGWDDARDNLEVAIRKALDGKSGTINGVPIDQIRFSNSNGNFTGDGEMFRTSQDFNIRKHRG